MPALFPRREFLTRLGARGAATIIASPLGYALMKPESLSRSTSMSRGSQERESSNATQAKPLKSPFRVSVINDEISQDFGHACEVASREFGMEWIELRGMWNKNVVNLDAKEVAEAQRILHKYNLRATNIASPLFKVDWKGAPQSKFSTAHDFHADFTFDQQDEVLERAIEMAKAFGTARVRCFDFWRLEDQGPYREAINEKLLETADIAGKNGIVLLLDTDFGLN